MPLTIAQQNLLSVIQQSAERLVREKAVLDQAAARWANEFPQPPTTEDLLALPEFAHVTQGELISAATALVNVKTTLGDWTTPDSAVNALVKIVSGGIK